MMALDPYTQGDALVSWVVTRSVNGTAADYSSGYTFSCTCTPIGSSTYTFNKTTGITGAAGGVITVNWTLTDLGALVAGRYRLILKIVEVATSEPDSVRDVVDILAKDAAP